MAFQNKSQSSGFSMEEIKSFIKELFDEERKEREKSFKNFEETALSIISANQKIMNDRMDKISLEITDLRNHMNEFMREKEDIKKSVETHQDIVDKKLNDIKSHVQYNEENTRTIFNKLRTLEDRTRRNNIRIDGLKENENETWEECEEKVKSLLKEKLHINDVEIERAHRVKGNKNKTGPKTIVAKILNWKVKNEIIKSSSKLKDTGYFINEDFSSETLEIRKQLRKEVKALRNEGKYAVIKYDRIFSRDFRIRN